MSLTLERVGYTYAVGESLAQEALRDVDLDVAPGEIVLVAGPTGSGKSTLLRIAAGLVPTATGTACLDGEPLTSHSARGAVGIVFQNPEHQLFAETVYDDVVFGPRNLGFADDEVRAAGLDAMAAVGLGPEEFSTRSPFSLSGGEARRASIAGVLAMRPRYLLLDEPTAGLDARGRQAVHDIIDSVRPGAGVVVVSHELDDMMPMADRVLLLDEGRTVFWGPSRAIAASPDIFRDARLRPPALLDVQLESAARGLPIEDFHLEVAEAADALAVAFERRRFQGGAS